MWNRWVIWCTCSMGYVASVSARETIVNHDKVFSLLASLPNPRLATVKSSFFRKSSPLGQRDFHLIHLVITCLRVTGTKPCWQRLTGTTVGRQLQEAAGFFFHIPLGQCLVSVSWCYFHLENASVSMREVKRNCQKSALNKFSLSPVGVRCLCCLGGSVVSGRRGRSCWLGRAEVLGLRWQGRTRHPVECAAENAAWVLKHLEKSPCMNT